MKSCFIITLVDGLLAYQQPTDVDVDSWGVVKDAFTNDYSVDEGGRVRPEAKDLFEALCNFFRTYEHCCVFHRAYDESREDASDTCKKHPWSAYPHVHVLVTTTGLLKNSNVMRTISTQYQALTGKGNLQTQKCYSPLGMCRHLRKNLAEYKLFSVTGEWCETWDQCLTYEPPEKRTDGCSDKGDEKQGLGFNNRRRREAIEFLMQICQRYNLRKKTHLTAFLGSKQLMAQENEDLWSIYCHANFKLLFKTARERMKAVSFNKGIEQTLRDLPQKDMSRWKLLSLAESQRAMWLFLQGQSIHPLEFLENVHDVLFGTVPKINCLCLQGPAGCGKTFVMRAIARSLEETVDINLKATSNFPFNNAVMVQAILMEEPNIDVSNSEEIKKVLEGYDDQEVSVKHVDDEAIQRTPVLMTTNNNPWLFTRNCEDAFKARMVRYTGLVPLPVLKEFEEQIHPLVIGNALVAFTDGMKDAAVSHLIGDRQVSERGKMRKAERAVQHGLNNTSDECISSDDRSPEKDATSQPASKRARVK